VEYITEMLGLDVRRKVLSKAASLPYFLLSEYSIQEGSIGTIQCLFLRPVGNLSIIQGIKNHLKRLQEACGWPVVLELDDISRQRAMTLIKVGIAFVVPGKQLYLPFMGIALQQKWVSESQAKSIPEKLQPSAQMILFAFILGKNEPQYLKNLAKRFNLSAMTMSRAADQLVRAGLLEKRSEGVRKLLVSDMSPKVLYMMAAPFLIDPVRKTVHVDRADIGPQMFPSGLSALADKSRLNAPVPEVWGIAAKLEELPKPEPLIDAQRQCALAFWKYDPRFISGDKWPDTLSLAASLKGLDDERVGQALDELLAEVW
jgi:hypothetical protein